MIESLGVIYNNSYIDIIHDACKICYKGKEEDTMEGKLKYIEHKIKLGHESVIEHSNIVMMITSNDINNFKEYAEVIESSNYLHSKSYHNDDTFYFLFSGSIRAYKNIFRNIKTKNTLSLAILDTLYELPKEFFYDFIEAGIMDINNFIPSLDYNHDKEEFNIRERDLYNITGIDGLVSLQNYINNEIIGSNIIPLVDLLNMTTCTIYFKSISRIISQQLTRHRNAISQKSQRYVDEQGATFIDPTQFKDIYEDDTVYLMNNMTSDDRGLATSGKIGLKMLDIYNDLRDQGLKKEDARYFLPQGVETELYVTFTLYNLIHFLSLRVEKSAQIEIREIAIPILEDVEEILEDGDIFRYLIPRYMLEETEWDYSIIEEEIS